MVQILIDRQIYKQTNKQSNKQKQTKPTPLELQNHPNIFWAGCWTPKDIPQKKSSESGFGWKPRAYVPCICTYLYAYIVQCFWADAP